MARARKSRTPAPASSPRAPSSGAGRTSPASVAQTPVDRRALLGLAAVLLLGLLAYSGSFRGAFVFDDVGQIKENHQIRSLAGMLGADGYRMLPNRYVAYLTFALNHAISGLDTTSWHVVNLLVHLATAALVWAFVRLAFRAPRLRGSALAPVSGAVAFAASALFVAHPLATQAVSYVVQRITSLATLLYLLATVLWIAWRLREGRPRRWPLYAGVLVASLLALRTKEIAFTLPLALVLVEAALFEGGWRRFLPVVPVALLALLVPLTVLDLGQPAGALLASADANTRAQAVVPRVDYLRTQSIVIVRYLGMLALPVGQSIDHFMPVRTSWLAPDVAAATLLLLGLWALAGWLAWRSTPRGGRAPLDPAVRLVALGIAWFFTGLAVESSLIPIADRMNEHRTYLPMAGLLPGLAAALGLLVLRVDPRHLARDVVAVAGVASVVLAVATWNRNLVWRSEETLWRDAAEKSPEHERTLRKLGAVYFQQGRTTEAVEAFRQHLARFPDSVPSRVQLGVALFFAGRPAEAEATLREAVRLAPGDPEALFNLSYLLVRTGRPADARPFLEGLVRVEKDPEKLDWARSQLGP